MVNWSTLTYDSLHGPSWVFIMKAVRVRAIEVGGLVGRDGSVGCGAAVVREASGYKKKFESLPKNRSLGQGKKDPCESTDGIGACSSPVENRTSIADVNG